MDPIILNEFREALNMPGIEDESKLRCTDVLAPIFFVEDLCTHVKLPPRITLSAARDAV